MTSALRTAIALTVALLAASAANASTTISPRDGTEVAQFAKNHVGSLLFQWNLQSGEYTEKIIFTRTGDPNDPVWKTTESNANRIEISDLQSNFGADPFSRVWFEPDQFREGVWFWRLCNGTIGGTGCQLDDEIRMINVYHLGRYTLRETQTALRKTLARRMQSSYRLGYDKRISGCRRISYLKVRCTKISWSLGDVFFSGEATIWPEIVGGENTRWAYKLRLVKFDDYCVFVERRPRASCIDVIRKSYYPPPF